MYEPEKQQQAREISGNWSKAREILQRSSNAARAQLVLDKLQDLEQAAKQTGRFSEEALAGLDPADVEKVAQEHEKSIDDLNEGARSATRAAVGREDLIRRLDDAGIKHSPPTSRR